MVRRSSPICNSINILPKYLFIDTYKATPVTWDYNRCHSIIGLYYLLRTNIDLNSIATDQPGFEPRSPGPKAATLPTLQ